MAEGIPAYVYVDGGYVREDLRALGRSDRFDPRKPAMFVQNQRVAGRQCLLGRVFYYDAPDPDLSDDERRDQEAYFGALCRLPDTHVVLGELRKGSKKREQKGVDVQLAVDAFRAATAHVTDVIALVTGDADFAPLVRAIRDAGPQIFVFGFRRSLSERLIQEADRVQLWDEAPQDWDMQ